MVCSFPHFQKSRKGWGLWWFSFSYTCKKLAPSSLMRLTLGLNLSALLEWLQDRKMFNHHNNIIMGYTRAVIFLRNRNGKYWFLFPLPENPATFKAYFSLMWRKIWKNKTGYAYYLALTHCRSNFRMKKRGKFASVDTFTTTFIYFTYIFVQ